MYKVSVNEKPEIEIKQVDGNYFIEGNASGFDVVKNNDGTFHALYKGKSYHIDVLEQKAHSLLVKVNNKKSEVRIKNDLEDLLSKMGMDRLATQAMNEIKAPMPGLILKVLVGAGDNVAKGDNLLVVEAMKMENIIKAPGDGVVSAILTQAGDKVEKNQVLIKF